MAKYIGKVLSGTVLALCTVLCLTPQSLAQEVGAKRLKVTISGSIGMPGVTMQGLPAGTQTDENGVYTAEVDWGFTGTVTPVRPGYTFEPANRKYANLKENKTEEKYVASAVMYKISGTVGIPGVKMTGLPNDPNSGPDGRYSATVPYGFNGVVIPEKPGYHFQPESQAYDQMSADQVTNYKAIEVMFTISGTVSCSIGDANGIVLQGLPGNPRLGSNGTYRVNVPYSWHGKVTPQREGCTFSPDSVDYPPVLADCPDQDYMATVVEFTLSGTAGAEAVTLTGLPNDPITDSNGSFSVRVPYGFSNKVTPALKGYTFEPPFIMVSGMTADRSDLIFKASIVRLTVSGTISGPPAAIAGVKMDGLPGDPVTDTRGFYTAKVDFGFSGTVTPTKDGVTFSEMSRFYNSLEADQRNENYKALPVTYTVSGNVGQPNVLLTFSGLRSVTSGPDGSYSVDVPWHWAGTIAPKKGGFTFEPTSVKCEPITASATHDFQAQPITFTLGGKVTSVEAGPVPDAAVTVEPDGIMTKTDADGQYSVTVAYGWKGRITVAKDGVVFKQNTRSIETPVMRDMMDQGFVGQVKMVKITKTLTSGGEPIQGVEITAEPGNYKATTDAKGQYTISVPYGWTGKFTAVKEGWEIEPFEWTTPATDDSDMTLTQKPATQDKTPPAGPPDKVPPKPVDKTTSPIAQGKMSAEDQEKAHLREMLKELLGRELPEPNMTGAKGGTPTTGVGLLTVISDIAARTGQKIAVDATVKNNPVPTTADISSLPALLASLGSPAPYEMKAQGDTILVYKPISTTFMGDELITALESLATLADVPIVADENVVGKVTATIQHSTLEDALNMILAGTSFVPKRMPNNFYLVASGKVKDAAFPEVSVTRRVYLNSIAPNRAAELMSGAWTDYVKGSTDPNGHWITVTAPPKIADRIVADIMLLDRRPRQVLLTARVVSIERGNLLNLGVEWEMPRLTAGAFSDAYLRGTLATGDADPSGNWPWGVQIGYSPDRSFTNALTAQLNLLHRNGQADIVASPQLMATDGKPSEVRNIQEEWFMMTSTQSNVLSFAQSELQKIESGTILTITPHIGDSNDIQLEMAIEVSDSVPAGTTSGLPVVTRRQAKNFVTVPDGGTAAVSGLTENRTKTLDRRVPFFSDLPLVGGLFRNNSTDKSTREIAVFVTANIAPDGSSLPNPVAAGEDALGQASAVAAPTGGSFEDELRQQLAGQSQ